MNCLVHRYRRFPQFYIDWFNLQHVRMSFNAWRVNTGGAAAYYEEKIDSGMLSEAKLQVGAQKEASHLVLCHNVDRLTCRYAQLSQLPCLNTITKHHTTYNIAKFTLFLSTSTEVEFLCKFAFCY